MNDDIAAHIPDAGRAQLVSNLHCHACTKVALNQKDLGNFIIAFWSGFDDKTGEPVIRDGVFDENKRLAILKACTSCGPKIKKLHQRYSFSGFGQLNHLNDGPLKKMLSEIWPRRKHSWRLEIGWEILLPIMQQEKQRKLAQPRMS